MSRPHGHYHKDVSKLQSVDVYRVLQLFEVTDQALGHAVKKLMCAGKRGGKSFEQDVREAVDTLNRRLQMLAEDEMQPAKPDDQYRDEEPSDYCLPPVKNPLRTPPHKSVAPPRAVCRELNCMKTPVTPDGYCNDCNPVHG